jgi:hypothetical protein
MESELASDLLDVALRRPLRDEQPGSDLSVRQALTDKDCHLSLAAGETGRHHQDSREHSSEKTGTEFRYRSR